LLGLLLCVALLGAGRLVRHHLLLGPEGRWREELWLDDLLAAPAVADAPPPRPVLTAPLPLNACSADSLTLLPGVGPVLAARIVAAREAGLVFRGPADLTRVKGIGPALTARLAPLVVFETAAGEGDVPRPPSAPTVQESR
jgi:competence protein ComEA